MTIDVETEQPSPSIGFGGGFVVSQSPSIATDADESPRIGFGQGCVVC
jgi:hypothetical protein